MNGDGLSHSYLDEDEVLRDARARADEFGCDPVDPVEGAALRFLATTVRARTVVEVGTGTGVSGLWLLRGMAPDGVLTSIDVEPEHQRAARAGFRDAGYPTSRLRLINGMALDVLGRLADDTYDLVFVDAVTVEYPRYLEEAVRLLRPGGVVALSGMLDADPDPGPFRAGAASETRALREVLRMCAEDDRLITLPLPLGDGLLVVTKSAW